jgi:Protein of unknown function (DUF3892)
MTEHQVNCITKPNRESRHEHITHIGNIEGGWKMTREEAIRRIDSKQESYYTVDKQAGNGSTSASFVRRARSRSCGLAQTGSGTTTCSRSVSAPPVAGRWRRRKTGPAAQAAVLEPLAHSMITSLARVLFDSLAPDGSKSRTMED